MKELTSIEINDIVNRLTLFGEPHKATDNRFIELTDYNITYHFKVMNPGSIMNMYYRKKDKSIKFSDINTGTLDGYSFIMCIPRNSFFALDFRLIIKELRRQQYKI